MTLEEKQVVAATARKLIRLLELCDDGEFVDLVIDCVASNVEYPLEVGNLLEEKYLNLKKGDDIYYVDRENNEIEHGIIFSVAFKDWKVDSFSVDFDCGDFDEFSSGALGVHYFTNEKDAEFALRNAT